MNSYYKAVFDFGRPIKDKAPEEREIHKKMSVLAIFSEPPFPYPDLFTAIKEQQDAVDEAESGDRTKIALMRTKERIVDNMLRKYRDYVTEVADGDTDIILSSGFKHTKPRSNTTTVAKVTGVKNLNSEISGGLKLRWNPIENVSFYEVDVRLEEPVDLLRLSQASDNDSEVETPVNADNSLIIERPWQTFASGISRTEITGLKPLSKYEVRVRAKGAKKYGGYSNVVILIVT